LALVKLFEKPNLSQKIEQICCQSEIISSVFQQNTLWSFSKKFHLTNIIQTLNFGNLKWFLSMSDPTTDFL